ncbi:MAG TPA: hypothetical protein GXX47_09930 [Firmicutes bacterium]|nr:hypothetical protein [Bacillota bacterium]
MGFPRTTVGGLSVSRMIIGTNWFLGWSHQSPAKDNMIKSRMDRRAVADILEVFFRSGVDTIMGPLTQNPSIFDAIKDAEDRTGVKCIKVDTPVINVQDTDEARDETKALLDKVLASGAEICMPHHTSVEQLVDRSTRQIRRLEEYTRMIRERGMIPGLSAHMPEVVTYADLNNYDVETYIQIYNCMGFLMQLEVEWVAKLINGAKKPVMTIKPMAAGRVTPFVGLTFVWNTIRDQDMVTVGTMTPDEAAEVIELSLAILERRQPNVGVRNSPGKYTVSR